MIIKSVLFGLLGFATVMVIWFRHYFPTVADKAYGAAYVKAVLWSNPLFWTLAITAAFGCAALYLYLSMNVFDHR